MNMKSTSCTDLYCGCREPKVYRGTASGRGTGTESAWDESLAQARLADDGNPLCDDNGDSGRSMHAFKQNDVVVVWKSAPGGTSVLEGWGTIQSQIPGRRDLYWVTLVGDPEWRVRRVKAGASQVEGARLLANLRSQKRVNLRVQHGRRCWLLSRARART